MNAMAGKSCICNRGWIMQRDILAIGASAGGVEAISALLHRLPATLPAAVLVTLHRPVDMVSHLPQVLARSTALRVRVAEEGSALEHGTCFVSPPSSHLTLTPDLKVHLLPDGFYRSHNIDVLFGSLARVAGARTIGVVLSGMIRDGTLGLKSIKESGGMTLVQDPGEAEFAGMPESALSYGGQIDFAGSLEALAKFICQETGAITIPDLAAD
jgi:two-component system chemotaxis response regulator CheB